MSTIVIVSPEPWAGHFVSKHHYALELARRGHDVLFFGPPNQNERLRIENVELRGQRLGVVHGPRVARGLRFMPGLVRRALEGRWLMALERLHGKRVDVVWLFENSRFFDMRFAGDRLKIYHQVDMNQDFHPETAASTAEVVIALNANIKRALDCSGCNRIHIVSHGVSVQSAPEADLDFSAFNRSTIHAAYIGNLAAKYLDTASFVETVDRHATDVTFHMYGRHEEHQPLRQALRSHRNVVWWGWCPPEHIAVYLRHMDINMLVYRAGDDTRQLSNSHKILEYLLSGKVIVASYTEDYAELEGLLEMIGVDGNYVERFEHVLDNLAHFNSPELMTKRRDYALTQTYEMKLDQIALVVEKHSGSRALVA